MITRALFMTVGAFSVLSLCSPLSAQAAKKPFRVVIDPGHGGSDHGAVYEQDGTKIAEKDVTLLLARQVAVSLRQKGYEAILTRREDHEVSLADRTALANRLKADVFLSIHMNSAPSGVGAKDAHGIETFILNSTSDASSRRLAHLENSVLGGSAKPTDSPEGLDVALILKDLRLDANLTESKRLACHIQSQLVAHTPGGPDHNRGIKQALFHVLLGADMPSILVEAGFISSAKDRELVLSKQGQLKVSQAMVVAMDRFRTLKGTPQALATLSRCKVR